MQVDTANRLVVGGDPVQCLRKHPGRAATMHLKESSASDPAAVLGERDVDWRAIFDDVDARATGEIDSQDIDNGVAGR